MMEIVIAVFIGIWLSGAAFIAHKRLLKEYKESLQK